MDRNRVALLQCPYCASPLRVNRVLKTYPASQKIRFGVLQCSCDVFPIVEGILFLKKNEPPVLKNQTAVDLLRQGQYQQAVSLLFEEKRRAKIPYALLLNGWLRRLSFRQFLLILAVLMPASRAWFRYLSRRASQPTFWLALANLAYVKNSQVVVDVGCSVGWFLKHFLARTRATAFGLEPSFSALYLARKFILKNQGNLICADADLGLPFRRAVIDRIFTNDVFMYLKRKHYFLQETQRITKPQALVFLTHLHNARAENEGQGYGLTDRELKTYAGQYSIWGTADEQLFRSLLHREKHAYQSRAIALLPLRNRSYSFVVAKGIKFVSQRSPLWVERLLSKKALAFGEDPQLHL